MKRRSFLKGMFSVPAAVFAPAVLSQELSDDDAKEMLTEQLLDDFYDVSRETPERYSFGWESHRGIFGNSGS